MGLPIPAILLAPLLAQRLLPRQPSEVGGLGEGGDVGEQGLEGGRQARGGGVGVGGQWDKAMLAADVIGKEGAGQCL